MKRYVGITAWILVCVALASVSFAAEPVFAATGEEIGKNFGDMLRDLGKVVYIGLAGCVALVFILNRRYSDLAVFMVAVIVVGGFFFAPGAITGSVQDIWRGLTA